MEKNGILIVKSYPNTAGIFFFFSVALLWVINLEVCLQQFLFASKLGNKCVSLREQSP
jgi:hypothetical protein